LSLGFAIFIVVQLVSDTVYSASEALGEANFEVVSASIEVKYIDTLAGDVLIPVELTTDQQRELLTAFEKLEVEKIESNLPAYDIDSRVKLTLDAGHVLYVDSTENSFSVYETGISYRAVNNIEFSLH